MNDRSDLNTRLDALERQVAELQSKEAIRDCIYRINRGMDRVDEVLIASGYHQDAELRWRSETFVPIADWLKTAIPFMSKSSRVQHLIGNILIDVRGDEADVESYEIARHLSPKDGKLHDLITASRYLDRFARRDGMWRVLRRVKVTDWLRVMEGEDPVYDTAKPHGSHDRSDISYAFFGADPFRDVGAKTS